jgi:hypothetical protein
VRREIVPNFGRQAVRLFRTEAVSNAGATLIGANLRRGGAPETEAEEDAGPH